MEIAQEKLVKLPASELVLIQAVDDLIDQHELTTSTWQASSQKWNEAQLIELTMLVGHYAMLAGTLRSLGVQSDSGIQVPPWEEA